MVQAPFGALDNEKYRKGEKSCPAPRPEKFFGKGMICRFNRSPVMEQQNPPQNPPPQTQTPAERAGPLVEPVRQPDRGQDGEYSGQSDIPTAEHWDSRPASRPLLLIIAIVGVIAVVLFALSMCTSSVNTAAVDGDANPGQILQNNVNEAFSVGDEPGTGTIGAPQQQQPMQGGTATGGTQQQQGGLPTLTPSQDAQEQQMQSLEEQQEMQRQQEEMLQQQRDAVPSVLPENPPAPATLGPY